MTAIAPPLLDDAADLTDLRARLAAARSVCVLTGSGISAESGLPILFYTQVASVGVSTMVILFIPVFWGIGAFRPGEVSVEITQTGNDAGWFGSCSPNERSNTPATPA